jgi:hypothetical protein
MPLESRTNFQLPLDHPLSAMTYAHPFSPVMTGEVDMDEYIEHAKKVNASIAENGGVTIRETPGSDPLPVGSKRWYGVGGAPDADTGSRYPEKITRGSINETLAHIMDVERGNISRRVKAVGGPDAYVGGWSEQGETVLDATSVTKDRDTGIKLGQERGERAIFDAKNVEEIPVPHKDSTR